MYTRLLKLCVIYVYADAYILVVVICLDSVFNSHFDGFLFSKHVKLNVFLMILDLDLRERQVI